MHTTTRGFVYYSLRVKQPLHVKIQDDEEGVEENVKQSRCSSSKVVVVVVVSEER